MANVYLAEALRRDRKVAVKVLRLEPATGRFVPEIGAMASLQHPDILPLCGPAESRV
jgi:serine/threonine protein kinase